MCIRDRYTDPHSDYMVNLEKFVNAARNKGAWPVFITPLERRCFIDEEHLDIGEHTDYVAAMKQTAENLNVPLIDLYSCLLYTSRFLQKTRSNTLLAVHYEILMLFPEV